MGIIRLIAAVSLGLLVAWAWSLWRDQFDSLYIASAIWCGICFAIAAIYDLLARSRRASRGTEQDRQPK